MAYSPLPKEYCVYCGGAMTGKFQQICESCHRVGITERVLRNTFAKTGTLHCNHCNVMLDNPPLTPTGRYLYLRFLCDPCRALSQKTFVSETLPTVVHVLETRSAQQPVEAAPLVFIADELPAFTPKFLPHLYQACADAPEQVQMALFRVYARFS